MRRLRRAGRWITQPVNLRAIALLVAVSVVAGMVVNSYIDQAGARRRAETRARDALAIANTTLAQQAAQRAEAAREVDQLGQQLAGVHAELDEVLAAPGPTERQAAVARARQPRSTPPPSAPSPAPPATSPPPSPPGPAPPPPTPPTTACPIVCLPPLPHP